MSRERWGTFSVMDHMREYAFVAEVLLYDRLVIPFPPNEEERTRWEQWNPDLLDEKLAILGDDLAIRVPWDQFKHELFQERFKVAKEASQDLENIESAVRHNVDPELVTRLLLARDFLPDQPENAAKVWPIAAYPSTAVFEQECIQNREVRRGELNVLLAQKFLMPSFDLPPDRMLEKAVDLARSESFKEKRDRIYNWQDDVIENGFTNEEAIQEMKDYLNDYNNLIEAEMNNVKKRFAFLALSSAFGLAAAPFAPIALASPITSIVGFLLLDRTPNEPVHPSNVAAMFYDSEEQFMETSFIQRILGRR